MSTTPHPRFKWHPPDLATGLDFSAEKGYIKASNEKKQREDRAWRSRLPSYRSCLFRDCPDLFIDKTNFDDVSHDLSKLLKQWIGRGRYRKQHQIKGYAEKASIVASSTWEVAWRFLKCHPRCKAKKKQYPCGETDYCPACHWARIGDAIFQEYKNAYSKAGPWYAITIAFVCSGGRLTLVTRKDARGRTKDCLREEPYLDAPNAEPVTGEDQAVITACGEAFFEFLGALRKKKRKSSKLLLAGALAALDCHVEFFPVGLHGVGHGLLLHVHVLANTSQPLDWPTCQALYSRLRSLAARRGIRLQPDMHISPIQSKQEFLAWLKYVVKPLVFEKFYRDGAVECDDRARVFNDVFDDVVFNGLSVSYGHIKSPRRFGNMKSHVPKNGKHPPGDIGEYQYKQRIGYEKFKALRLREREGLGPLDEEDTAKLRYEEARRNQRREQTKEWREEKREADHSGRGHAAGHNILGKIKV